MALLPDVAFVAGVSCPLDVDLLASIVPRSLWVYGEHDPLASQARELASQGANVMFLTRTNSLLFESGSGDVGQMPLLKRLPPEAVEAEVTWAAGVVGK